mgnify:CR=1 FL=1
MKQERVDKINYYLDIAGTVAQRSTCRRRIYGAVIVQHDEIVSTDMWVPLGDVPTVWIWNTVSGRSCRFEGENAMNYVGVSMRKQMQSSVHSAVKCWEPICFW